MLKHTVILTALAACKVTTSTGVEPKVVGPVLERPTAEPAHADEVHPNSGTLYVWWQAPAKPGDKITGELIAVDIGDAAPKGKSIATGEFPVPTSGVINMASGNFHYENPAGWPVGKYKIDVKDGAVEIGTVEFAVK